MDTDRSEFRAHYEGLSDEALLTLDRDDLVEAARECYDMEMAQRDLVIKPPKKVAKPKAEDAAMDAEPMEDVATDTAPEGDLVELDSFVFPDESKLARALLKTAGIRCYLANEHTLGANWHLTQALGGFKLMVAAGSVAEAREVLASQISDEDLAAQAEAAGESEDLD